MSTHTVTSSAPVRLVDYAKARLVAVPIHEIGDLIAGGRNDGARLDAVLRRAISTGMASTCDRARRVPVQQRCLPTPVTFAGMPSARWWEIEDERLDLGAVDAHTTDLATLMLIEFGLTFGNDWSSGDPALATRTLIGRACHGLA